MTPFKSAISRLARSPAPDAASGLQLAAAAKNSSERLVLTIACGIVLGYAAMLGVAAARHFWILDAKGHPIVKDFVVFWVAGQLALKGSAIATYDLHVQHGAELAVVGHPFSGMLGWSYPPLFLLVAAALASLPYAPAFLVWNLLTSLLYAGAVATIARRWAGFAAAYAAPWVFIGFIVGQNGFLTAAIIGLVLLHLEKRPALAGLLLALLSYKPQLGILFPYVLAAGGYWRAFAWAAIGVLAWNGIAGAVFGFGTFAAFLHALRATSETHLTHGGVGWALLQSAYGAVRSFGGSNAAAWLAQGLVSVMIAAATILAWRRRDPPISLKAALLAAAVPLVTPYVFVYDLPVLAVAIAFLFRHRSFDKTELVVLAVATPCVFALYALRLPTALLASIAVFAIALRRCYPMLPRNLMSPSWATDATSLPSSE